MLKDYAKGNVDFTYRDDALCLFFSPNRMAQLRLAPPEQRQNVVAELANRFIQNPEWPKDTVTADMIVWDILREEGWALPRKEKRSKLSTMFPAGTDESTE